MTLNITVLTPDAIYQSADYMLFDQATNRSLAMPSTKVVILSYLEWTGFITYTGIGRVGSNHTCELVQNWIESLNQPTFDQVVDLIRARASSWVASVKPGHMHTFVIAAFVKDVPTAAVVSNFQRWQGAPLSSVLNAFEISTVVARRGVKVIVTGVRHAVPRPLLRGLQHVARQHADDPARVRRALAAANSDGARRFSRYVSSDCFVYSQDRNGRGSYEAMGATPAKPEFVVGGESTRKLLEGIFGPAARNWSMVGMTSVTSEDNSSPPPQCELRRASQGEGGYRLIDLAPAEGRRATPIAVNERGVVVGDACPVWRGPSYPCIWPTHSQLEFLAHGGGLGGRACGINNLGIVVGSSELPDRASPACVWTPDGTRRDIGTALGRHSQALAINAMSNVVGYVSISSTEGGQSHFRPAYWSGSQPAAVLDNLRGGWGEAVDVNSAGVSVLRVHEGSGLTLPTRAEAWLWDGQTFTVVGKPSADTDAFYPHRITERGEVIGLAIQRNGARIGAMWEPKGTWLQLSEPRVRREFLAANDALLSGGWDTIDGYQIPWIKRQNDALTYLPHYQFHHHQITKISQNGLIVGTARADNCSHPLLWTPS